MDWTQIELFKGIDLTDSFVLKWEFENDQLSFDLEASICPESTHFFEPKSGEYACYRNVTLKFKHVKSMHGLKLIESVLSTIDPDGSTDYGNIETLCQTKIGFNLSGDFGTVNIIGGELDFEVLK